MELTQTNLAEITVSYRPQIAQNKRPTINSSLDAYKTLLELYPDDTISLQEQFVVLFLNRTNKILGAYKLSVGGITGTVADPRLILGTALKVVATGLILSHNHPSGNLKPSKQDEELTKTIKAAARFMDINVLDHLILSPEGSYLSFADEGLL